MIIRNQAEFDQAIDCDVLEIIIDAEPAEPIIVMESVPGGRIEITGRSAILHVSAHALVNKLSGHAHIYLVSGFARVAEVTDTATVGHVTALAHVAEATR